MASRQETSKKDNTSDTDDLKPGGDCTSPARRETHDDKEAAIVAAARKTFLAMGFDAASMDAIAAAANVSKRTVYNRFRSKEDLFAASILETCRNILPPNLVEIEENLPPRVFVRQLAERFVRGVMTDEAVALHRIAGFEASRTPALGQAYMNNGPALMAAACSPVIARLAERHDIPMPDVDRAIWQLGALLTEPLYTKLVMGLKPDDLDKAIEMQISSGLDAFFRIYAFPKD